MRALSGNTRMGTFESGIGWRRTGDLIGHGGGGWGSLPTSARTPLRKPRSSYLTNAEHGLGVLQDLISPFMKSNAGSTRCPILPAAQPRSRVWRAALYRYVRKQHRRPRYLVSRRSALMDRCGKAPGYYDSSYLEQPPAVRLVPAARRLVSGRRERERGDPRADCARWILWRRVGARRVSRRVTALAIPAHRMMKIFTASRIVTMAGERPEAFATWGERIVALGSVADLRERFPGRPWRHRFWNAASSVPGFNDCTR